MHTQLSRYWWSGAVLCKYHMYRTSYIQKYYSCREQYQEIKIHFEKVKEKKNWSSDTSNYLLNSCANFFFGGEHGNLFVFPVISQNWHSAGTPDSKVHGANMLPTWFLSAPDGPHVGPMNLAIRYCIEILPCGRQWLLTQGGWDKMAAIFLTTFSSAFSWMKSFVFWLRFHWSLFVKGAINNIPALVQMMTWRRPGDKPLSDPMMVSLLLHWCITRPQWVNVR